MGHLRIHHFPPQYIIRVYFATTVDPTKVSLLYE